MKRTHREPMAAVGGRAVTTVILGSLLLGCPRYRPCDDPAWKEVCEGEGDGGRESAGEGSKDMSGGADGTGGMTSATAIDCAEYPTLSDMDKFFARRCGASADDECHATALPWTDMKSPEVWRRLADRNSMVTCKDAKLIDTKTWSNSVILAKTKTPVACPPGGSNPGLPMPPPNMMPMMAPLSAAETTCLENYLKKIAGM